MRRKREKGKSHSTRPVTPNEGLLAVLNPEEIKSVIIDLAKKEVPPSKIGIILRDQYGVPLVKHLFGKKLFQILKEEKLEPKIPEDLSNLIKRAQRVLKHLEEHPSDYKAKKGLEEIISKINRLTKYYKRERKLSLDWKHGIKLPK